MEKSQKELRVEEKLLRLTEDISETVLSGDQLPVKLIKLLLENRELKAIHDYANTVSITRIGLNDHGPVHMKKVCYNALKILRLLHEAGIKMSIENEEAGTLTDSVLAVMLAALLHDSGMTVARKSHEFYSGIIAYTFMNDILREIFPCDEDITRITVIRSLALEGIFGHMAISPIHSMEAGIVLVADGCDMTKGRARIPLEIPTKPTEGDIHKYSAHSIEKVRITKGDEHPVKIEIMMRSEVGFFQVEEVLIPKISASPAKAFIELHAGVSGEEMKRYR